MPLNTTYPLPIFALPLIPTPITSVSILGSSLDDNLRGSAANDRFETLDGDDVIRARSGDDLIFSGDGNDTVRAGKGDDYVVAGLGDDRVILGTGNDFADGGDGNDRMRLGKGNDVANGGVGEDRIHGGEGDDLIFGGADDDRLFGGTGNDTLLGEDGDDRMNGGGDDDVMLGGDGDDRMRGGDGDDDLYGEDGNDRMNGGDADDLMLGGDGDDRMRGGDGDDTMLGGEGNDRMRDGYGDDTMDGGDDDDNLIARWGNDDLHGGDGNDRIVSRADGGEPEIAQAPGATLYFSATQPFLNADDVLTGGAGADQFIFRTDINGTYDVVKDHTMANGRIHWHGVAGENGNPHDHWAERIGNEVITDYSKAEGDTIKLIGHTIALGGIERRDVDEDGVMESILTVISDQGGNGGAHDQDILGTVTVFGDEVTEADVRVNANPAFGVVGTLEEWEELYLPQLDAFALA